jgi:hypothetical protein
LGRLILTEWVFPPLLFRKAVLNPIPASARHLKGSGFLQAKNCHTYVLRFKIKPEDVPLILASDQFKEIGYVRYSDGILGYGESEFKSQSRTTYLGDKVISTYEHHSDIGLRFALFEGWRAWFVPRWFQLAQWRAFKAYAVERRDEVGDFCDVRLLVHNPDAGEVYFIAHYWRGHWAWSLF